MDNTLSQPVTFPEAERLLRGVRRAWRQATLGRAALESLLLLLATILLLGAADLLLTLPVAVRVPLRVAVPLLCLVPLLRAVYRAAAMDDGRIVLLAEERIPALQNRLATARSPSSGALAARFRREAAPHLTAARPRDAAPWKLQRLATACLALVLILAGAAAAFPQSAAVLVQRWRDPAAAPVIARGGLLPFARLSGEPGDVLPGFGEIRWTVQPPAYTGLPPRSGAGESISALVGSRVTLTGATTPAWEAVVARTAAGDPVTVAGGSGGWSAEVVVGASTRGVIVTAVAGGDTSATRLLAITPTPDQPPRVLLQQPAEDMVLARPAGRIPILARADDDFGVVRLGLSYILSRGGGESFAFEEGEWQWSRLSGPAKQRVGEYSLDLSAAGLRPGDVLHIRAVAADGNPQARLGEAVSETRIIRIANPDEQELVTTPIGVPPEAGRNPVLSQRMLILLTEKLLERAPGLGRAALLEEANDLAFEQQRLRERIGEQIFTRSGGGLALGTAAVGAGEEHEHGESPAAALTPAEVLEAAEAAARASEALGHTHDEAPVIAVSRPLIAIFNAMYAAERELRQAAMAGSLPHQHRALELLKAAQQTERVYARGRVQVPVVDVAAIRGSGDVADARPAARQPSTGRVLDQRTEWRATVERAISRAGDGALDPNELDAFAARLLADPAAPPQLAALISRAAGAVRGKQRATAAELLLEANRTLRPDEEGGWASPLPRLADPRAAEYFSRLREIRR